MWDGKPILNFGARRSKGEYGSIRALTLFTVAKCRFK